MEQQSKVIDSTISLSNISDLELLKQLIISGYRRLLSTRNKSTK